MNTEEKSASPAMNRIYRDLPGRLMLNAERDLRLARCEGEAGKIACARARLDTLNAALGIYQGAHRAAYGSPPWAPEGEGEGYERR